MARTVPTPTPGIASITLGDPTDPTKVTAITPVLDLTKLAESEEAEFSAAEVNVPQQVKDFVDAAHTFWQTAPKKWRKVALGSEAAVKETRKLATKYAKSAGRTFRVKTQADASLLVYKVTDARGTTASTPPEDNNG